MSMQENGVELLGERVNRYVNAVKIPPGKRKKVTSGYEVLIQ
jgi:hypothetical protein